MLRGEPLTCFRGKKLRPPSSNGPVMYAKLPLPPAVALVTGGGVERPGQPPMVPTCVLTRVLDLDRPTFDASSSQILYQDRRYLEVANYARNARGVHLSAHALLGSSGGRVTQSLFSTADGNAWPRPVIRVESAEGCEKIAAMLCRRRTGVLRAKQTRGTRGCVLLMLH